MGLFDIFTGDPVKKAAEQQQQYLTGISNQIQSGIGAAQTRGIDALQSGQGSAIGALQGGQATARGDIQNYSPQAIAALYGGQTGGTNALLAGQTGGLESLRSGVQGATDAFSGLAGQGQGYDARALQGGDIAQGAFGLGPMAGQVQAAFQSSPGYQFQLNQGLESVLRNANASGMAAGGNQLREAQTYGQGLANQDYGAWRAGVSGLGQAQQGAYAPLGANAASTAASGTANAALTGGTGAANIYTGTGGKLSDLLSGTGTNVANTLLGTGTSLANLAQRGGEDQSGVYTGTGNSIANLLSTLSGQSSQGFQNIAGQYSPTFQTAANAEMAGSKNLWNLGLNLAGAGAGTPAGSSFLKGLGLAA